MAELEPRAALSLQWLLIGKPTTNARSVPRQPKQLLQKALTRRLMFRVDENRVIRGHGTSPDRFWQETFLTMWQRGVNNGCAIEESMIAKIYVELLMQISRRQGI